MSDSEILKLSDEERKNKSEEVEVNSHTDDENSEDDEYNQDFDVCKGCHWCNPKSYPEKPVLVNKLPEGHIISIHCLTFKYDEGIITDWDNWSKMFSSYESASKAILDFYKKANYDNLDDNDYEKPPIGWACKEYNPEALSKYCFDCEINLFGEYSDTQIYCRSYPKLFFRVDKPE